MYSFNRSICQSSKIFGASYGHQINGLTDAVKGKITHPDLNAL